jgi:hypothetical protein
LASVNVVNQAAPADVEHSETSTEDLAGNLTILRLSGDERNLKLATTQVELDGPAAAATAVAHDIDLSLSTRTTINADLTFLVSVGDVVAETDADRHVALALAILEDPAAYVARLRPSFGEYSVLRAFRSLMTAAGDATRRAVVGRVLGLGGQQDQLTAKAWAGVVSAGRLTGPSTMPMRRRRVLATTTGSSSTR